jgi:hypothetical protein
VFEGVIITDEAFSQQFHSDERELSQFLENLQERYTSQIKVLFLIRDFRMQTDFSGLAMFYENLSFLTWDFIYLPIHAYNYALKEFKILKQ